MHLRVPLAAREASANRRPPMPVARSSVTHVGGGGLVAAQASFPFETYLDPRRCLERFGGDSAEPQAGRGPRPAGQRAPRRPVGHDRRSDRRTRPTPMPVVAAFVPTAVALSGGKRIQVVARLVTVRQRGRRLARHAGSRSRARGRRLLGWVDPERRAASNGRFVAPVGSPIRARPAPSMPAGNGSPIGGGPSVSKRAFTMVHGVSVHLAGLATGSTTPRLSARGHRRVVRTPLKHVQRRQYD
jgi:hypothetical protein